MIAKMEHLRIPFVRDVIVGLTVIFTVPGCTEESTSTRETVSVAQNTVAPTPSIARTTAPTKSAGATKETGTTRSAVELMAAPFRDAKSAGQLPANTKVDVLERRGGWLKITAQGKTGWAKLHQVSAGVGPEGRSSSDGLAILKSVGQTGRSGTQGIVATTGIRGMSAEELRNAKPDPTAVKRVDAYSVTASQARDHAKAAGLKEANVPPLPKSE